MYMGGDGMISLDTMEQLHAQIDDKTLEKVQSTRDFVIKTGDDDILMTFRWLDHSVIVLHTEAEQTTLWAENPVVRRFAEDIEGTGREELFRFLVEVSADDLLKLDDLEDRVAAFETALFDGDSPSKTNFREIHRYRQEVWSSKRYFEKMELLTDELMAMDSYFIFIDKKYDKLLNQILRTQEYLDQIRQSYEAQVSIEQNSLMKYFTVVTSVFLPLTLLVGWYGMNLRMPEFRWAYGYPFVIVLSIAIVVFMIWQFRRNKWL